MSAARQFWMIENRSGPHPVYFCMAMHEGEMVVSRDPIDAHAFPSRYACLIVMDEWELDGNWQPINLPLLRPD